MTTTPSTMLPALLALALFAPLGCAGDDDDDTSSSGDDEAGDTIDEPEDVCKSSCQECTDHLKQAYSCLARDEWETPVSTFDCMVCDGDGAGYAAVTCQAQASLQSVSYATMEAQLIPCTTPNPPRPPTCTDWDPSAHVRPTSDSEWTVDRDLLVALVADPSPLVGCDSARVKQQLDGSYRVASPDPDDLLTALGLADGDVIQEINGHSIGSPADVALAFLRLWPSARAITVNIIRPGEGALRLSYKIV
jgi:hypothetical protein